MDKSKRARTEIVYKFANPYQYITRVTMQPFCHCKFDMNLSLLDNKCRVYR